MRVGVLAMVMLGAAACGGILGSDRNEPTGASDDRDAAAGAADAGDEPTAAAGAGGTAGTASGGSVAIAGSGAVDAAYDHYMAACEARCDALEANECAMFASVWRTLENCYTTCQQAADLLTPECHELYAVSDECFATAPDVCAEYEQLDVCEEVAMATVPCLED